MKVTNIYVYGIEGKSETYTTYMYVVCRKKTEHYLTFVCDIYEKKR